jgi:integrase
MAKSKPSITTGEAKKWPPKKPYPTFPLTITPKGYVKKVKGRVHHIAGRVSPDRALQIWADEKAPVLLGTRRAATVAPTHASLLSTLVGRFLEVRLANAEAGTITPSTYRQERRALRLMLRVFDGDVKVSDLHPDLFSRVARRFSRFSRGTQKKMRNSVKQFFNYAGDAGWTKGTPSYGTDFRILGRKVRRAEGSDEDIADDTADGDDRKTYSLHTCQTMLVYLAHRLEGLRRAGRDNSGILQLLAMVLLSLNGGYGAAELSQLRWKRVYLDEATPMIRQKRRKTGTRHRCVLWPETLELLKLVRARRPNDELVFRTREGNAFVHEQLVVKNGVTTGSSRTDAVANAWGKAMIAAGILKRDRLGYYRLKHTHRSISGGAGDEAAADMLVGHQQVGMRKVYQQVTTERVGKVAMFVRDWLSPHRLGLPPGPLLEAQQLADIGVSAAAWPVVRLNQGRRGESGIARRSAPTESSSEEAGDEPSED